jgi:superfamily II DNA or RNA helicase
MEAICSRVLYKIDPRELMPKYLAPAHVFFSPVGAPGVSGDWRVAYQKGVVDCDKRNALAAGIASTMSANGIPTIVLTRRRAHADYLGERIPNSVVVKGGENALTSAAVRDFLDGRHEVLVGTTVIGEGVDVPRAGALVYASGGSDGVSMAQSYYRPLTAHPGKPIGRIYDFRDTNHRTLRRHSEQRANMARSLFGANCVRTP